MNKYLQKITENPKILLWPAAAILVLIGMIVLVLIPQFQNFMQTQQEITQTREKNDRLSDKVKTLDGIDANAYSERLLLTFKALPESPEVVSVVSRIQGIATQNNLELVDLGYLNNKNSKPTGKDEVAGVKLTLNGEMSDLKSFLSAFAAGPRVIKLDSAEIGGSRVSTVYQSNIGLNAYYRPKTQVVVTEEGNVPTITPDQEELLNQIKAILAATPDLDRTFDPDTIQGKDDPFN